MGIKQSIGFLCILMVWGSSAYGQLISMQNSVLNTCQGILTDSGGAAGDYGPNETFVLTICPDGTQGTHTRLTFSGTDIAVGDLLCFFDGQNILAPSLGCHTKFLPGQPFIIQASPMNSSGCITVTFSSNGIGQGKGWQAKISCEAACQAFDALIVSSDPPAMPTDTGWIDVCPGASVTFEALGIFPQNNVLYTQHDTLCTYIWNFGDGTTAQGKSFTKIYDQPGGYHVTLTATDQFGCRNTNVVTRRVRVAPAPVVQISNIPGPLCPEDTIQLSAGIYPSTGKSILLTPIESEFELIKLKIDSLPLPDGNGVAYHTTISFSDYPLDAIINQASDIQSLCLNLEHSWMRDLQLSLTCPTGQTIVLVNQEEKGDEVFLGIPYEGDELLPIPIPGTGYTYCWQESAPNGTWLEYANLNNPKILPEANYAPYESFNNLIGCPLNGDWTLTIQDLWPIDNGFIFWWDITFAANANKVPEKFTPVISLYNWEDDLSIIQNNGPDITAIVQQAGEQLYLLTYTDNFGCAADTFVRVKTLPTTHPQCLNCQQWATVTPPQDVCKGDTVQLDVQYGGIMDNENIRFTSYPMYPLGYSNHPPVNPYQAPLTISPIYPDYIMADLDQILEVCFTLETYPVNNIAVYLEAPDGKMLELTTYNGGLGSHYINTCFSPTAIPSITSGTAPFSGTYRPEGSWNSLIGAPINGTWKLHVSDNFGLTRIGLLKEWSMRVKARNATVYQWTPGIGLSCVDCPSPMLVADQPINYQVTVMDMYGCDISRDVAITVKDKLQTPILYCGESTASGLIVRWDPVPGAGVYEVRVNGGAWVPANGTNEHLIGGLFNGTFQNVQVRALNNINYCDSDISEIECYYLNCAMYAVVEQTAPPSCFGGSDGEVFLSAFNGASPFTYNLNGNQSQGIGYFNNVTAGNHFVIVTDALGCMDTVYFMLGQPDPISINIAIDSVSCYGGNNGGATAMGSGGTPGYNYIWFTIPSVFNPTISNRPAGNYTVRVIDSNNCMRDSIVSIGQPLLLTATFTTDSSFCAGQSSGTATIWPDGGNGGYSFLWQDGQQTQQAVNLAAGSYFATVTDAKGCTFTGQTTVHEGEGSQYQIAFTPPSCHNGTNASAWVTVVKSFPPLTYQWNDPLGQVLDTAYQLSSGPWEVYITNGKGCKDTLSVTISNPDSIQLGRVVGPPQCMGSSEGTITVVIQSGGTAPFSYLWNDPQSQTTSTATQLGPGTYTVTVTDANGCSQSISGTVVEIPGLTINVSSQPATCQNSNDGSLTPVISNGMAPFSFLWNDPSASTDSILLNTTTGIWRVTVTDVNGCTGVASGSITSTNDLQIAGIMINQPNCNGENSGSLSANVLGGSPAYQFMWSDPSGQTTNPAIGLFGGQYSVTVTDNDGCTAVSDVILTEPQPLLGTIDVVNVTCRGDASGSASITMSGGTPQYTYTWSTNPIQTGATATNLSAGMYSITITDAKQCEWISSVTISEPSEILQSNITQSVYGCAGSAGNVLSATSSGGTGTNIQFLWSNGDQNAVISNLPAGTYSVTITDEVGCTSVSTITANDLLPIQISLAGNPPNCFNTSDGSVGVTLISGGSGNGNPSDYNFNWSTTPVQNGQMASGLTGNTTYVVTATDNQGCTGTASYLLDAPSQITGSFTSVPPICNGSSDGSITLQNLGGGTGSIQIAWSANAGGGSSLIVTGLGGDQYFATLTDSKGCFIVLNASLSAPPVLTPQLTIVQSISCHMMLDGQIEASATGGNGGYTYLWNTGATESMLSSIGEGQYQVTVTDSQGCTSQSSIILTAPLPLSLQIEEVDPDCNGSASGQIIVNATGGTGPYQYMLNQGGLVSSGLFANLKEGDYTILVIDDNGCETMGMTVLIGPQAFAIDAGSDITIELGESVTLNATSNATGSLTLLWNAVQSGQLSCSACPNPVASPLFTTTYTVTGTDERGCRDIDDIVVFVIPNRVILVPTAFTPNNDGQNDLMVIHGKDETHIHTFQVFDRWGEKLFEANDFEINNPNIGWDGRFRGSDMNGGVYIWVLEAEFPDGYRQQYSGQTTLIR